MVDRLPTQQPNQPYIPTASNGESRQTLVYLVRHGLTDWNREKRFQGQSDVPLNEIGVQQARSLAGWLLDQPLKFSAIYSSDLSRAWQTADAIRDALGL